MVQGYPLLANQVLPFYSVLSKSKVGVALSDSPLASFPLPKNTTWTVMSSLNSEKEISYLFQVCVGLILADEGESRYLQ